MSTTMLETMVPGLLLISARPLFKQSSANFLLGSKECPATARPQDLIWRGAEPHWLGYPAAPGSTQWAGPMPFAQVKNAASASGGMD